jgi:propanol-preferring alcohol dehydrogenase
VRIRISCCALCRTDLHVIEGDLPRQKLPVIVGHQVVGVVDMVGEGAGDLAVGQRIGIAWLRHTCGACALCRRGRENLCESSRYTGYHADGGYAEYAVAPEAFAYAIPDVFGDVEVAPLLCGGIIGYRALRRANVPEGGSLLLVGFGSSAHIVMQLAAYRGCDVYVLSRGAAHQRLALDMGATWAGDDPARLPARMDSAIIFAPAGRLVPPVLEALRPGGTLSLAGIHMSEIPPLDYARHLYHERDVHTVTANTRDDGRSLLAEAAQARIEAHTATYDLPDANRALLDMKQSRIDGAGVLLIDT